MNARAKKKMGRHHNHTHKICESNTNIVIAQTAATKILGYTLVAPIEVVSVAAQSAIPVEASAVALVLYMRSGARAIARGGVCWGRS